MDTAAQHREDREWLAAQRLDDLTLPRSVTWYRPDGRPVHGLSCDYEHRQLYWAFLQAHRAATGAPEAPKRKRRVGLVLLTTHTTHRGKETPP